MIRLVPRHIRSEAGDSLVEVLMGIVIMTAVLVSAYTVATVSFHIGQNARERSVAANILQEQAEALRNYRDSDPEGWNAFHDAISGASGGFTSQFHMERKSDLSGWQPVLGTLSSSTPGYADYTNNYQQFTFGITPSHLAGDPVDGSGYFDRVKFDLTATWPAQGSSVTNTSTISTTLVKVANLNPCRGAAGNCTLPTGGGGGGGGGGGAVAPVVTISAVGTVSSKTSMYSASHETARVTWNATGTGSISCVATGSWSGTYGASGTIDVAGGFPGGSPASYTLGITCTDSSGGSSSPATTIFVYACEPRQAGAWPPAPYGKYSNDFGFGVNYIDCTPLP